MLDSSKAAANDGKAKSPCGASLFVVGHGAGDMASEHAVPVGEFLEGRPHDVQCSKSPARVIVLNITSCCGNRSSMGPFEEFELLFSHALRCSAGPFNRHIRFAPTATRAFAFGAQAQLTSAAKQMLSAKLNASRVPMWNWAD